ncbi:MAG: hypothetical protein AB7O97_23400 [Planctomycetota bacterium]
MWTTTPAQTAAARAQLGARARGAPGAIRVDDSKYHLARTPWRHVPMTRWQQTRANALLAPGADAAADRAIAALLSPRQRVLAAVVRRELAAERALPSAVDRDATAAAAALTAALAAADDR